MKSNHAVYAAVLVVSVAACAEPRRLPDPNGFPSATEMEDLKAAREIEEGQKAFTRGAIIEINEVLNASKTRDSLKQYLQDRKREQIVNPIHVMLGRADDNKPSLQINLMFLQAAQNQRIIEQNDAIIALLGKLTGVPVKPTAPPTPTAPKTPKPSEAKKTP